MTNSDIFIALSCISPSQRDLIETIMLEWKKHYKELKKTFPDYEPTHYGFAYWLVRYSGLIKPITK